MVAAFVRLQLLCLILCASCCSLSSAIPLPFSPQAGPHLFPRAFIVNNATETPQVFNSDTGQAVPQGLATDAGGINFSATAILWIAFCFAVGAPMSVAGIRGWRFTIGVGLGLSAAVCSWTAFVNSVNNVGVPDPVLSAFVFGFFFLGFVLGLFEFMRVVGMTTLGIVGGLAFGARIAILKQGLLISNPTLFVLNWLLVAMCGIIGASTMILRSTQRGSIVLASASTGTFLLCLGLDLIVNKQSGMSRGLRFLFDRNVSHLLDLFIAGYKPPLSTQATLVISLGLTPFLAYIQHRVFKHPFSRKPRPDSAISYLNPMEHTKAVDLKASQVAFPARVSRGSAYLGPSRFSL